MDELWRIELFGGLTVRELRSGGQVLTRFRTQKMTSLLAYLACFRQRGHAREEILELFWPEAEPEAGRLSLRVALSQLRSQLEPPDVPEGAVLVADRLLVHLNPAAVSTDVAAFEEALRSAKRIEDPVARTDSLIGAVEIYRGDLLPGFYDEWIVAERERLKEAYRNVLHDLVTALTQAGDPGCAMDYALRALADDPWNEAAHTDLMYLYALTGRLAEAQHQFEEMQQLRDASLIFAEEQEEGIRFKMLETVREYGAERLEALPDDERRTQERFAASLRQFARVRLQQVRTPEEAIALLEISAESDNLSAALEWAQRQAQHDLQAELALALGTLRQRCGFSQEAVAPIEAGLQAARTALAMTASPAVRRERKQQLALLLCERAGLHLDYQESEAAREKTLEALAFHQQDGNDQGAAHAQNLLGQATLQKRAYAEARGHFAGALKHYESVGNALGMAVMQNNLGLAEYADGTGRLEEAAHHYAEALRLYREKGDRRGVAEALINLGALAQQQAVWDEAWRCYAGALQDEQTLGHLFGIARALFNLGETALAQEKADLACPLFAAAERLFDEMQSPYLSDTVHQLAEAIEQAGLSAEELESLRQSARGKTPDELTAWALEFADRR